jgi:RNA recognition motif-containing protein
MSMKLYVGNLSFETTSEDLTRIFSTSGKVASAVVVTDRSTGDSKGFGFVEMASKRDSDIAIRAINGKEINGRTITVNEARSREERGDFRSNY